jgi:hypothetical protein
MLLIGDHPTNNDVKEYAMLMMMPLSLCVCARLDLSVPVALLLPKSQPAF